MREIRVPLGIRVGAKLQWPGKRGEKIDKHMKIEPKSSRVG
jgi:hypothetical protein